MVRAMIDYYRARKTQKRGGELLRVDLTGVLQLEAAVDRKSLPAILDELASLDRRKADVVRLRVFWGASVEEISEALDMSVSSVGRDWRFARRWLAAHLVKRPSGE